MNKLKSLCEAVTTALIIHLQFKLCSVYFYLREESGFPEEFLFLSLSIGVISFGQSNLLNHKCVNIQNCFWCFGERLIFLQNVLICFLVLVEVSLWNHSLLDLLLLLLL